MQYAVRLDAGTVRRAWAAQETIRATNNPMGDTRSTHDATHDATVHVATVAHELAETSTERCRCLSEVLVAGGMSQACTYTTGARS